MDQLVDGDQRGQLHPLHPSHSCRGDLILRSQGRAPRAAGPDPTLPLQAPGGAGPAKSGFALLVHSRRATGPESARIPRSALPTWPQYRG